MTCSNLNSPAAQRSSKSEAKACSHCGLPVYGKNLPEIAYCCCGCEMAAAVLKESKTKDTAHFPPHLFRVVLAFILSMFITLLSATIHQEQESAPEALALISFALTLIVFMLLSKEFLQAVSQEIRRRTLSIATLVFIGSGAAFLISTRNLVLGHSLNLYYETASMALTLYVVSLTLDAHFKLKLSHSLSLWREKPSISILKILADGEQWRTDASMLETGNRFALDENTPFPVDAFVINGYGEVDESHLTGEPLPVFKTVGDTVKAGAIWRTGNAQFEASSPYGKSSLHSYYNRVLELKAKQSAFERLAEKGASLLLVIALAAASFTFIFHAANHSLETGLIRALSILLISCPCGLAIATPIAFWLAIYRLEEAGITVSGCGTAIEKLASIQTVLIDKTGTLTEGITLSQIEPIGTLTPDDETLLMRYALALESTLEHPIAQAFRDYGTQMNLEPEPLQMKSSLPGIGTIGTAIRGGETLSLALLNARDERASFLKPNQLTLFVNHAPKLVFTLAHQPKAEIENAITALEKMGLTVGVLTGDSAPKPDFISCSYHAALSPSEKASLVRDYESKSGKAVFIGDGINDLEAMTTATTSVAMFRGAAQAKSLADFTLFNPSLSTLAEMISFARTAKRKVMMNLTWAIGYNSIGIVLAVFGFLTPLWAIAIMTASSAMVTLNSLSLLKTHQRLSDLAAPAVSQVTLSPVQIPVNDDV